MKKNSSLFGRYLSPNIIVNTSGIKDYFDFFLELDYVVQGQSHLIIISI